MGKQYVSIVLEFDEGSVMDPIGISDKLAGGAITHLAHYDLAYVLSIAEGALDNTHDPDCLQAKILMDDYVAKQQVM